MKVKICGITNSADGLFAAAAGADAIGLNFIPRSRRRIDTATAARIAAATGSRALRVGVFADVPAQAVEQALSRVELDLVQFHGQETGDYCRKFGVPFIKAVAVTGPLNMAVLAEEYRGACGLLLDAPQRGAPPVAGGKFGGTGTCFDWTHWPTQASVPLFLAGGLNPENVADAITALRPDAVDVSGGVEGPTQGMKDPERVRAFIDRAKMVNQRPSDE